MYNSKFAAMCRFNPIENSATLTASFAKRAGMVGTAEYNYLVSLRKSNPGLVVLKATHASPTPKTDEEGKVKPRDPFDKVSYYLSTFARKASTPLGRKEVLRIASGCYSTYER
ncbi:MAG: hypothetical protein IJZ45_07975 [Bacteroidaceae bacterium]|nr:hypothetical protein [Bacteroidaceae bacterium]